MFTVVLVQFFCIELCVGHHICIVSQSMTGMYVVVNVQFLYIGQTCLPSYMYSSSVLDGCVCHCICIDPLFWAGMSVIVYVLFSV